VGHNGITVNVRFREATSADVAAIAECRSSDPAAGPADWRMAAYFGGRHHPKQALPPRVGYVAVAGNAVVGYTAGHLTTRYGYRGEVQYLFVAPEYRRHGVATALLQHLAAWFRDHHATRVCVDVNLDSPSAAPFYERTGARSFRPRWWGWDDITVVLASPTV
jgi:GNAT superfamily N-acetyltransferase